jgi:catechol 2,3-dioxygenase-like lactoylglutathione lyase family enzyme
MDAGMESRITVITIGVDDLERSVSFYRDGLGLPTDGIVGSEFEHGSVAFFDLQGGIRLALWPRASITHDTGIRETGRGPVEFTLGHNVDSPDAVDTVMTQAENAGARIVKPAGETFWGGYAGYFQDPDDHLWEIVWNPAFEINAP